MKLGIIILILLFATLILRIIITVAFQKSTYNAYKNALKNGDIDDAVLKGRSYYLSLSKKKRECHGIIDVVQIDARVKEDIAAARAFP